MSSYSSSRSNIWSFMCSFEFFTLHEYNRNSKCDQLSEGLIAQLVEHCTIDGLESRRDLFFFFFFNYDDQSCHIRSHYMHCVSLFFCFLISSDIDECTANSHDCHESATCTNTGGSFTCACNLGYTGNGKLPCTGKSTFRYSSIF